MNRLDIASKLSEERIKKGITLKSLESTTGIPYRSIQRTLGGYNSTIDQILKISDAVGLDLVLKSKK